MPGELAVALVLGSGPGAGTCILGQGVAAEDPCGPRRADALTAACRAACAATDAALA
jgi:hypothetical protein